MDSERVDGELRDGEAEENKVSDFVLTLHIFCSNHPK